jgi:long-chain fatty acid transport protein
MKKISALFVLAVLAAPAYATNGMRMIGFGPVQGSMGGVGVGATLDASSIISNPAGIAGQAQRFDLSLAWFKPTVSYKATGSDFGAGAPPPEAFVNQPGATLDSDRGGSPIPSIGYVRPISENLYTGVGVFGVAGMGVDYPQNLYSGRSLTSYLQGRLVPGVAYKVNEMFSVGVAANVMMAQMEYDVASGAGQAKHDTATSFGFGGTVGVKFTPTKMVSFGAAYESRSYFQDFEFDVPARTNPFTGQPLAAGTDELAFDQPMTATFGFALMPLETLVLGADVQWINWSDTMGENLPEYVSDPSTGAQPFNMNWSDQWVFKVGAQFEPMKGLSLRAGYNYGKMPLDADRAFENLVFPAVAEHHITAGVGYNVTGRLALQVAGMYSPAAKISGANGGPPQLGGQAIASYETEMSQFQIDAGATFRF